MSPSKTVPPAHANQMAGHAHIRQIRNYCLYIEDHLNRVHAAWRLIQDRCGDLFPLHDDFLWNEIDCMIREHDLSKFSPEEFIPYQRQFFPAGRAPTAESPEFQAAWEHHKAHNPHHWEHWTRENLPEAYTNQNVCHCVCMIADWVAMGEAGNDSAETYYREHRSRIALPLWAHQLVITMLERIYR